MADGVFWSALDRFGQQSVQFVIGVVLARILMPEEFGLIAMLAIFMAIAQTFIDGGFGQALIQSQSVDRTAECTIFYFNILVGFTAVGLLFLAAPWIAAFYEQPSLVALTRVLALNLVINAFGIVQTAILTKRMNFKIQLKVGLIATILSGVVGITMAYRGFGVWSLVALSISSNLARTALLWLLHSWRPVWTFNWASLRTLFGFGSMLLLSSLLFVVFRNIYLLVIGKLFTSADLGFYTRADQMQRLSTDNLSDVVCRVTFSAFSSVQDDKERLKNGVQKAMAIIVLFNFPIMVGLIVVAEPLVHVLLTDKWLPSVPYLQLLCLVGLVHPFHAVNVNVLAAQGRSDLVFKLALFKRALIVISIAVTFRWGISALICGQLLVSCMTYYSDSYYTGKFLGYTMLKQIRDVLPTFILAVVMGICVWAIAYLPFESTAILLATQILTGGAIYIGCCYLFRLSAFIEAVELINLRVSKQ